MWLRRSRLRQKQTRGSPCGQAATPSRIDDRLPVGCLDRHHDLRGVEPHRRGRVKTVEASAEWQLRAHDTRVPRPRRSVDRLVVPRLNRRIASTSGECFSSTILGSFGRTVAGWTPATGESEQVAGESSRSPSNEKVPQKANTLHADRGSAHDQRHCAPTTRTPHRSTKPPRPADPLTEAWIARPALQTAWPPPATTDRRRPDRIQRAVRERDSSNGNGAAFKPAAPNGRPSVRCPVS